MKNEATKTNYLVAFHEAQIDMLLNRKENRQDRRSLKEKIKEVAREVAEFSLAPGVSSIVRSEVYVKLTWIFCQLFLLVALGYLVAKNIVNYLQYDVNTQVSIINEVPFDFPTVTLCNVNFFQSNYSIEFLTKMSAFYNISVVFDLAALRSNMTQADIQKFSYPLNQTLFTCVFSFISCDSSSFDWFFHPQYGNCNQYKTTPGGNKIIKSGISGGLQIQMFVGIPVYLQTFTYHLGLAVFIHSPTTSPLSIEPVMVSPSQETNIVVSKMITEKQPMPYSNCQDNVETPLKSLILNQGTTYTQQDCMVQCYQAYTISKCMCYDDGFVNYHSGYFPCINQTQKTCVKNIGPTVVNSNFIDDVCLPQCPLECSIVTYTKSLSTNAFPTASWEASLWNTTDVATIFNDSYFTLPLSNHILALNVYFESLSYMHIVETPAMDVITLISNLGGSMGLMLGLSLATLVEFVELGVKILIVVLEHHKHKWQNRKVANVNMDTLTIVDT